MSAAKGDQKSESELSLNLSFVDRVEEKLTSPDRETLSPTKQTVTETRTEEVEEDVNGNVIADSDTGRNTLNELDNSEKVESDTSNINAESNELKDKISIQKSDTENSASVVEGFIDRKESHMHDDLNQGTDLKIDMEGRKKASYEASLRWYEDQDRRNNIFDTKANMGSEKNAESERISSQLLDKTREMFTMDFKKEDKNTSKLGTDEVSLVNDLKNERFEMYNAINNQSSRSKVDEMLPEVVYEYGNLETDGFMGSGINVDTLSKSYDTDAKNLNSQTESKSKVQTADQKQTMDFVFGKADAATVSEKSQKMKNKEGSKIVAKEHEHIEKVEDDLIFEEDEENVIIHFGSEFSQDQLKEGVAEESVSKQEVITLEQEAVTETRIMGKEKQMTLERNDLELSKTEMSKTENIPPVSPIEVERKFKVTSESRDKLIELGASLLEEKIFTDRYVDDDRYSLTLADAWLRQRNQTWELKLGRQLSEKAGLSTQYNEISDEKEIVKFLTKHFKKQSSLSPDMSMSNLLQEIGLSEFAVFTTTRQSYGLPECTIDLDLTDFGFQVGEVEVMVMDESHIPEALDTITDIAEKLGMKSSEIIAGKMSAYLRTMRPHHYNRLLKAGVLPYIHDWSVVT